MIYKNTYDCISDLERHNYLVRIKEEVDPYLEMAAIHRRVFEAKGPAILFENIKGTSFKAVSNLYGTLERSKFIFRDTLKNVQRLTALKGDPSVALKHPFKNIDLPFIALKALPKKTSNNPILQNKTTIDQLPQIKSWPKDGGAFITLPIVYSEDINNPGVMNGNLGMYRVQLSGNEYELNKEVGLHYQIHRGIGVHQSKANEKGQPLKVSIFIGGPPAHTIGAIMPLPEGLSELTFSGALAGRRFRYSYHNGYCISSDADFVITGEIHPFDNKPEGPFGDHLGYYSLQHDFPVMKVTGVYHRKNAIWPFTVVGRPPQEDTSFGELIHEIVGPIISKEIPGVHSVHAVDAAGVHPLLLAIGSERYTPYNELRKPQELLTLANNILGKGQLSLAKYLWIGAKEDNPNLNIHDIETFFKHILERVDWRRDLHFHTNTTIDTLDYSGTDINSGSKVVIAATGKPTRRLSTELPIDFNLPDGFSNPKIALPGVLVIESKSGDIKSLISFFEKRNKDELEYLPLFVIADDSDFTAKNMNNFVWVTFTRSNPSHDIHGINSFIEHKHWGCKGSLIIDARIKQHHAPLLEEDPVVEKKVDALGVQGKSLYGII